MFLLHFLSMFCTFKSKKMKKYYLGTMTFFIGVICCQAQTQINIDSLTIQIQNLKSELTKSKEENAALNNALQKLDQTKPRNISCSAVNVLDNEVYAIFTLDKPGRIKAEIYDSTNTIDVDHAYSSYDSRAKIHFKNLLPNKKYFIRTVVIDEANNEIRGTVLDFKGESKLNIHTSDKIDDPDIDFQDLASTANSITIPCVVVNGQKVTYSYECNKITTVRNVQHKTLANRRTISPDELGKYANVETDPTIVIKDLNPESDYEIILNVYNEYGRQKQRVFTRPTLKSTESLKFVNGLIVNYNPLQTSISWKVNIKPDSAKISFMKADKTFVISKTADFDASTMTCSTKIDYAQFLQLINLKDAAQTPPVIVASMKDKTGNELEIPLSVTFSIPTTAEINAANNLTQPTKDSLTSAITKVTTAKANETKKKLSWTDIVQLGIPILLSAF